jgi:putative peptide zinc metalloprotease protein
VVLAHELAHALACTAWGGRVTRLGLMIRHGLPAAFADVSDVHFLPRRARVAVYLAGPLSTLGAAALAALAALGAAGALGPGPAALPALLALLAALAALSGLVALCPVAGYDGSEALAEWLGVPDLHRRALAALRGRRPASEDTLPAVDADRRRLLAAYGVGFLAYNVAAAALVVALLYVWLS